MYQIEFKQSVLKDLKKIEKKFLNKILKRIDQLKNNPYRGNIKKLIFAQSCFRVRVGNYRIVFQVLNDEKKVIVYYIRHRKDVYKNL